ncbi:MAG: flavin oxidoreductase, partial [Rhizobacter sp.]|nr:flavin oxidoreductase [Rhizobacter sp.]
MSLNGAPAPQHRIEIAQGGPAFDCGADEFILTAAERAGWTLPASCRAGICGTCEGGIDSGRFVLPGRNGEGELQAGPAAHIKLCRVKPRSDLSVVARDVRRTDPAAARVLAAKVLKIEKAAADVAVL